MTSGTDAAKMLGRLTDRITLMRAVHTLGDGGRRSTSLVPIRAIWACVRRRILAPVVAGDGLLHPQVLEVTAVFAPEYEDADRIAFKGRIYKILTTERTGSRMAPMMLFRCEEKPGESL